MAKSDTPLTRTRVAVFAYDHCSAWITTGLLELFGIANIALQSLGPRATVKTLGFDCHLLGRKRRVRASHGLTLCTRAPADGYAALIVPSLWGQSRQDFEARLERLGSEHEPLRQLSRRTRLLASACSGAVLLAGAGLLDGHRATTCWWLGAWFQRRFERVQLLLDRLVVTDRERWTAAAGSAYMHLGLELVRELAGDAVATASERLMLVERRRGSQSPFLAPQAPAPFATDDDVRRALAHLDAHAAGPLTIAALCRATGIHARTLARKFERSLGMSPLSYLQSRRVARAKQLLAGTTSPLEHIVVQCGYEDVSSFRKLFARQVGMTPREYRSRFGG